MEWSITSRRRTAIGSEKFAAAKAEFDQLERDGIIRRSDSPWASPQHMVKKADGSWRPWRLAAFVFVYLDDIIVDRRDMHMHSHTCGTSTSSSSGSGTTAW
jgi:hypothetical protein